MIKVAIRGSFILVSLLLAGGLFWGGRNYPCSEETCQVTNCTALSYVCDTNPDYTYKNCYSVTITIWLYYEQLNDFPTASDTFNTSTPDESVAYCKDHPIKSEYPCYYCNGPLSSENHLKFEEYDQVGPAIFIAVVGFCFCLSYIGYVVLIIRNQDDDDNTVNNSVNNSVNNPESGAPHGDRNLSGNNSPIETLEMSEQPLEKKYIYMVTDNNLVPIGKKYYKCALNNHVLWLKHAKNVDKCSLCGSPFKPCIYINSAKKLDKLEYVYMITKDDCIVGKEKVPVGKKYRKCTVEIKTNHIVQLKYTKNLDKCPYCQSQFMPYIYINSEKENFA